VTVLRLQSECVTLLAKAEAKLWLALYAPSLRLSGLATSLGSNEVASLIEIGLFRRFDRFSNLEEPSKPSGTNGTAPYRPEDNHAPTIRPFVAGSLSEDRDASAPSVSLSVKPDLVAAQQCWIQQQWIVRGKNDLCPFGILRTAENQS